MSGNMLMGIMDIFIIGCGLYGFFSYFRMKKGGPIDKVLILGKDFPEEKCKDVEALRARTLPALLIFSILTTLCGIAELIDTFVLDFGVWNIIVLMIFFVQLFWFVTYTTKARNVYF